GSIPMKFECDEALSAVTRQQIRSAVSQPRSKAVAYGVLVDIKTKRPVYLKKENVLIGRGEGCDIQLNSQTVSSQHARIYKTSRGFALADLDSHNGTKLNGRYINQPQLIFDEDMLTFGDKVFIFYEK
nr:FHA domain-containing protein [Eubacterium sp.]